MSALLIVFIASAFSAEVETHELPHRLPRLISVFPQGSRPGARLHAEVLGEFLDRASSVMFLDESISGKVIEVHPTTLGLEFNVGSGAANGPHYFRVLSPRGASNVLPFRVGDLPHITEQEPNSTFAEANSVEPPVTINGRLNVDGDFDFYRFRAEAGQTWIFDLRAARNGNGLDAALILLDEQAREITRNEDYFIWDPFIEYKFERSGTYTVVVQPTHTQLDPNFAYQLDIRTAPHLETVSPISMTPGANLEATLRRGIARSIRPVNLHSRWRRRSGFRRPESGDFVQLFPGRDTRCKRVIRPRSVKDETLNNPAVSHPRRPLKAFPELAVLDACLDIRVRRIDETA